VNSRSGLKPSGKCEVLNNSDQSDPVYVMKL
jgi:hypothetical protein